MLTLSLNKSYIKTLLANPPWGGVGATQQRFEQEGPLSNPKDFALMETQGQPLDVFLFLLSFLFCIKSFPVG